MQKPPPTPETPARLDATVRSPRALGPEEQATLAGPTAFADDATLDAGQPIFGRYLPGAEIGRGGMGVVWCWNDPHIGREVAAKVLLDDAPRARARFLHEARTQGCLEHPSIVPVHDLATLPDGRPFFTMQRVRGETLTSVLEGTAAGNPRFSQRKVLDAFGRLALAVHYAHVHGVIHRDLKPANLMLGEFGEVYVLDWGIARRVAGEVEDERDASAAAGAGLTESGSLLGTPGYMAPEQARADADLDARSDVYALGCVLFEILAGEPMHQGASLRELVAPPLERSPMKRAPDRDVPPELDALCLAATAPERDERLASARLLAEGIERYLEGDRDLTRSTISAQEHARNAARLCDRALGKGVAHTRSPPTDAEAEEARREALLEVSRAVALSPEHPLALATLVALLTEPPKRLPAEVSRELEDIASAHARVGGRTGALAYGVVVLLLAGLAAVGVVRVSLASVVSVALFALAATVSFVFSRLERPGFRHSMIMLALSTSALASLTTLFGPFVGTPTAVCVNTMIFVVSNGRRYRAAIVGSGVVGTVVPIALELVGVLPPSFRFQDGTLVLLPRAVPFDAPAMIALGVCFVGTVVISSLALVPFRDDLDAAQEKSRVLSWQLRQFVPTRKR